MRSFRRMLWRITGALIVLFWAVMTGLLVRDTYFPEESRFAEVPPALVWNLFLRHDASGAALNTLHLYHDDQKLGHATFSVRKRGGEPSSKGGQAEEEGGNEVTAAPSDFEVSATGMIDGVAMGRQGADVAWRIAGELAGGEHWRKVDLQTRWSATDTAATLIWKEGEMQPAWEVRQGDELIMSSKTAAGMLPGASGMVPPGLLPGFAGAGVEDGVGSALNIRAREGTMDLAGRRRKCYVLHITILGMYEAKAIFTEAGELARVDLPQGYRLLEPMIHGLDSGMKVE